MLQERDGRNRNKGIIRVRVDSKNIFIIASFTNIEVHVQSIHLCFSFFSYLVMIIMPAKGYGQPGGVGGYTAQRGGG